MSLRTDVLRSRHGSVLAGHPGREKTINLVLRDYSWPGVKQFIRSYVRACDVCSRIKTPRHKPYGLLRPLDIPDRPWKSISMDFIVKLPKSHGYDSIWVVCDRLTRYAHFIPCNMSMDAPGLAWLFLDRIFRYHGLPSSIISDRGSTFVSKFWTELTALLQTQLKHSTAYHPQTDGLTERTNQSLETYLHAYVSYQRDDWVNYLPLAKFAFNNHESESTKTSPFFANFGFHPAFDPQLSEHSPVPAAADIAARLSRLHDELRTQLKSAQDRQSHYYNQHVADSPKYEPGQLVWLLRRHIKTTRPSNKLDHRRLGPFPINHAISDSAYKLRLPSYLSHLHPVFHVSLLEPYHDPSQFHLHASPVPFELVDDIPSATVHSILESRKLGQQYEYLVRWKDLSLDENSWGPLSDLPTSADELIERYHRRHPKSPRPPSSILHRSVHESGATDATTLSSAQVPLPAASSEPARPSTLLASTCPHAAIPSAAPRPPSPAPLRLNPCVEYTPPSQTTLCSGRVSRPPPRPDA